jgi:hypothetical protein
MSGWWNQRSLFVRLLVYALAVTLAFVMAASVGAVAALMASGNLSWPTGERARPEEPSPAGERGNPPQRQQADTDRSQQEDSGAKQDQAPSPDKRTTYVDKVGEIQSNSVETFLDSHGKLLRYDSLTGEEVDKMQVNTMALGTFATQAGNLDPPRKYSKQYKVFHLAVDELRDATELAHTLAADPISATQADFDNYDRLVDEAAAGLQQSNKILGKDYKTMKGVRSASTS